MRPSGHEVKTVAAHASAQFQDQLAWAAQAQSGPESALEPVSGGVRAWFRPAPTRASILVSKNAWWLVK
jgi:hypothetical protein